MFNENYQNSKPEILVSERPVSIQTELSKLDHDYWAIIDEINIETIKEQIANIPLSSLNPAPSEVSNQIEDYTIDQFRINELSRIMGPKLTGKYLIN